MRVKANLVFDVDDNTPASRVKAMLFNGTAAFLAAAKGSIAGDVNLNVDESTVEYEIESTTADL